jgi:hypothetical protein
MQARLIICCLLILPFCVQSQTEKKKTGIAPHYAKLQFAGSIGFLSAAVGYEFAKKKLQADVYYGYVPQRIGGINIHSVTGKLTWLPLSIEHKNYTYNLLTAGFLVNYAFGKQYDFSAEAFDYYGFPTAAHIGLFVGGGIKRNKLGLYYELGSTDRDIVSYVNNTKGIRFHEIINIGIGARWSFW